MRGASWQVVAISTVQTGITIKPSGGPQCPLNVFLFCLFLLGRGGVRPCNYVDEGMHCGLVTINNIYLLLDLVIVTTE